MFFGESFFRCLSDFSYSCFSVVAVISFLLLTSSVLYAPPTFFRSILFYTMQSRYSTRVEGSEDVPNVFFVEGDPLSPLTLMRAGLPTAEQVATLAPVGKVMLLMHDVLY